MLTQTEQLARKDQKRQQKREIKVQKTYKKDDGRKYETRNKEYARILIEVGKPDPDYPEVI